jgi:hypothetical protein
MQDAFGKNPWEFLDTIRPVQHAGPHPNPDMVPILFEEENKYYIGWQMSGTLPILFGCDFKPGRTLNEKEIILPRETQSPPKVIPPKNQAPRKKQTAKNNIAKTVTTKPKMKEEVCIHCEKPSEPKYSGGKKVVAIALLAIFGLVGSYIGYDKWENDFGGAFGGSIGAMIALFINGVLEGVWPSRCNQCGLPFELIEN